MTISKDVDDRIHRDRNEKDHPRAVPYFVQPRIAVESGLVVPLRKAGDEVQLDRQYGFFGGIGMV